MSRHIVGKMDVFRGDKLDSLNTEPSENIEIRPVETSLSPSGPGETEKDLGEIRRNEKVELLMKNIREFIRGIDTKAL
ncbi:MAG: hypothetical protein WAW37_09510 [Syntrophobacteraceae bacterium]